MDAALRKLPSEAEMQLVFARLNVEHFGGLLRGYRIAYNPHLASIAGRINYRPPVIELSSLLLTAHPERAEETLLHEMIHAWLRARRLPTGHGCDFKRKMGEVGLPSIYHGIPVKPRTPRYLLVCPRCRVKLPRLRRPSCRLSCARCSPRFDPRVELTVRRLARS